MIRAPERATPSSSSPKRRSWAWITALPVLVAAVVLALSCGRREAVRAADLLLTNGSICTMDGARSWVEAVAVTADKIVYAGPARGAGRFRGARTKTIDLGGRLVLPGFQDSHIHLVTGGIELGQCNLNGLRDKESVFAAVRDYAARNPGRPWITGGGWDLPVFPKANPGKDDLDKLVPDRPACLESADGHSSWVNSMALKIAGVTRTTPDPPGGRIERDPKTGEPTGTLRESAADLVDSRIPELADEDYIKGLRAGLDMARRVGITSIIEANAREKILDAYAALDRSGELTLRVLASLYVDPGKGPSETERLTKLRDAYRTPHLKATTAKIFADGVVESHTAALLEPYLDRPGDRGEALVEPAAFDRLAIALDAAGFQIHVHAIGDRAIRMSLDAMEAARRAKGPAPSHRPPRTHRPGRYPPLPGPRRHRQFPAPVGLPGRLHHRPDGPDPRPDPLPLAVSDRERRPDRRHDRGRERLVGFLRQSARGHPGGLDAARPGGGAGAGLDPRGGRGPANHARRLHDERGLAEPRGDDPRFPRAGAAGRSHRPRQEHLQDPGVRNP